MRQTKEAFYWITSILEKNKIYFRITGGLAARIYGSKRKLADIDIDLDQKYFRKIIPEIKPFILFGPKRNKDNYFDIYGLSLRYKGQVIDICGIRKARIYDKENKKWLRLLPHFNNDRRKKVYGSNVFVQSKKDLIDYKRTLGRKVDKIDIEQLSKI